METPRPEIRTWGTRGTLPSVEMTDLGQAENGMSQGLKPTFVAYQMPGLKPGPITKARTPIRRTRPSGFSRDDGFVVGWKPHVRKSGHGAPGICEEGRAWDGAALLLPGAVEG